MLQECDTSYSATTFSKYTHVPAYKSFPRK